MTENATLESLITRGLVRKAANGKDYIIIKSKKRGPRSTTAGPVEEYAITVEDFLKGAKSKIKSDAVEFDPTGTPLTATDVQSAIAEASGLVLDTVVLPAAVLAMGGNNVTLLPPPGANKAYDIQEIILWIDFNSVAYSAQKVAFYGCAAGSVATDFLTATFDRTAIVKCTLDEQPSFPMNQALKMGTVSNSNPTTGDSKIYVTVKYRILTFG